jgi:5'-nucleotidase
MKTNIQYYIICLLLTISCNAYSQKNLVILHTNDTHSRIEPLPKTDRTSPGKSGVVRRAELIDQVKLHSPFMLSPKLKKQGVLLLL